MNKKFYETPHCEIDLYKYDDIITTSSEYYFESEPENNTPIY